jgi:hypothetical protein
MQSNGADEKCQALQFAEQSDDAAEPYTGAHACSLECDAIIHRIGARP